MSFLLSLFNIIKNNLFLGWRERGDSCNLMVVYQMKIRFNFNSIMTPIINIINQFLNIDP